MRVVFAKATTTVSLPSGAMVGVQEGSHWSDEDEIVQTYPDLFSYDARHGMLFTRPLRPEDYPGADRKVERAPIEQATAAPGDRRNLARRG